MGEVLPCALLPRARRGKTGVRKFCYPVIPDKDSAKSTGKRGLTSRLP
jgi:hypothetical protein